MSGARDSHLVPTAIQGNIPEANKIWKELIDEATPVPDTQGIFLFRGEAYKVPQRGHDGKVHVVRNEDERVLWAGVLEGPLEGADKRLRAKLKQRQFLLNEGPRSQENTPQKLSPSSGASNQFATMFMSGSPKASNGRAHGNQMSNHFARVPDGREESENGANRGARKKRGAETHHSSSIPSSPSTADRTGSALDPDLSTRWKQLLKREGFDQSFQNAILERVQTPRRSLQTGISQLPSLNSTLSSEPVLSTFGSPMTSKVASMVEGNVEEVPPHLRKRALSLKGMNDDEQGSSIDAEKLQTVLMGSDFISSQGVKLNAGTIVTFVRKGKRGWTLVRDSKGLKSWVPHSYLTADDCPDDTCQTLNDMSGEITKKEGVNLRQQKFAFLKSESYQVLNDLSGEILDGDEHGTMHPGDCVHDTMEDERFAAWMSEVVENKPQAILSQSNISKIEEIVIALERNMDMISGMSLRRAFEQLCMQEDDKLKKEQLALRVGELKELADVDLFVKIEERVYKEREQHEKERYMWFLEKKRLEAALGRYGQVQETDPDSENEWSRTARSLTNFSANMTNNLSNHSSHSQVPYKTGPQISSDEKIISMEQELISLSNRLAESEQEKSDLRSDMQNLKEHIADRDVALATVVHGIHSAPGCVTRSRASPNPTHYETLVVENETMKQHVKEQNLQMEAADEILQKNRELIVTNATLQKKHMTQQQQISMLTQKLQKLEQHIHPSSSSVTSYSASGNVDASPDQMKILIADLQTRCASLEQAQRVPIQASEGSPRRRVIVAPHSNNSIPFRSLAGPSITISGGMAPASKQRIAADTLPDSSPTTRPKRMIPANAVADVTVPHSPDAPHPFQTIFTTGPAAGSGQTNRIQTESHSSPRSKSVASSASILADERSPPPTIANSTSPRVRRIPANSVNESIVSTRMPQTSPGSVLQQRSTEPVRCSSTYSCNVPKVASPLTLLASASIHEQTKSEMQRTQVPRSSTSGLATGNTPDASRARFQTRHSGRASLHDEGVRYQHVSVTPPRSRSSSPTQKILSTNSLTTFTTGSRVAAHPVQADGSDRLHLSSLRSSSNSLVGFCI